MRRRTAIVAFAAACSTSIMPNAAQAEETRPGGGASVSGAAAGDPWEPVNRAFFAVSDVLDQLLFRPVAMTYRRVLPRFIRKAAHNVVSNLEEPSTVINDALQGKFKRAGTASARFVTNSTLGVAGLMDVAAPMGLTQHDNDFGLTLGKWNLEAGPYLYVPLAGPSSVRDLTGRVVDMVVDPIGWLNFRDDEYFHTSRTVIGALDARVAIEPQLQQLEKISVDPYASLRSIYLQSRESQVHDGALDVEALPDFPDADPALEPQAPAAATPDAAAPAPAAPAASAPAPLVGQTVQ